MRSNDFITTYCTIVCRIYHHREKEFQILWKYYFDWQKHCRWNDFLPLASLCPWLSFIEWTHWTFYILIRLTAQIYRGLHINCQFLKIFHWRINIFFYSNIDLYIIDHIFYICYGLPKQHYFKYILYLLQISN